MVDYLGWCVVKRDSDILHYGILGMKWGIRRYQNKDGTLTPLGKKRMEKADWTPINERPNVYIEKGQKVNRVGQDYETDKGRTYASLTEADFARYTALRSVLGASSKIRMEALNGLKIAGSEAQMKALKSVVANTPIYSDMINKPMGMGTNRKGELVPKETKWSKNKRKEELSAYYDIFTKGDTRKAQKVFNIYLWENSSSPTTKKYIEEVKKMGYQGLIDFTDAGYMDLPMMIFDRGSDLKTVYNQPFTKADDEFAKKYLKDRGLWIYD